MLQAFNTVPHGMLTPDPKIILIATSFLVLLLLGTVMYISDMQPCERVFGSPKRSQPTGPRVPQPTAVPGQMGCDWEKVSQDKIGHGLPPQDPG